MPRMTSYSSFVTGMTERRPCLMREMSLSRFSFLISSSVTGFFKGFTGARSTATHLSSSVVGS